MNANFKLLVVNGPNLNLLGTREPEIYGSMTLDQLNKSIMDYCESISNEIGLRFFQSNHEGAIIDIIHDNRQWANGLIINPGAYTHYSYAIRDAISGVQIPTVEVHLSDIHNREEFRNISVIAPVCLAQISGLGKNSYFQGIDVLLQKLN